MRIMRYTAVGLAIIASGIAVAGQTLSINKVCAAPFDASAQVKMRKDLNQEPCALIKVQLTLPDAVFMGNIVGDVENIAGEYWVYVIDGTRQLHIHQQNVKPLVVYFPDWEIAGVEGGAVYIVDVETPKELWGLRSTGTPPAQLPQASETAVSPVVAEKDAAVLSAPDNHAVAEDTQRNAVSAVAEAGTLPKHAHAVPRHLDFAAELRGTFYYFTEKEWKKVPEEERRVYGRKGIVVIEPHYADPFILALTDEYTPGSWDDVIKSGRNLPSVAQGWAVLKHLKDIEKKLKRFGGLPEDGVMEGFWTNEHSSPERAKAVNPWIGNIGAYDKNGTLRIREVYPIPSQK